MRDDGVGIAKDAIGLGREVGIYRLKGGMANAY